MITVLYAVSPWTMNFEEEAEPVAMAKEEKGNNRTHTNNCCCEAHELPVQLQIETTHWGTLVVDCCIPQSTASEYLATQNLTTPNFFFEKSPTLDSSQKSAQDQQSMDPKVPAVKTIVCIHSPTAITLSGCHFRLRQLPCPHRQLLHSVHHKLCTRFLQLTSQNQIQPLRHWRAHRHHSPRHP